MPQVGGLPSLACKRFNVYSKETYENFARVVQYTQSESSRVTLLTTRVTGSYVKLCCDFSYRTLKEQLLVSTRSKDSQVTSRYESTRLDFWNSRVDIVRLSTKVLEVVVEGVCKMSSSRVESLRVDMTRL